mmetsp:Transcript_26877/g.81369  ORF Transcript_26877/g.81369 Transcript_26877/m.81369 type:complete len:102 (-) Transcript_26877:78-383(-)|eukprot:scaffold185883_cov31-Tisochrysis_lutea.AAC.3
MSSCMAIAAWGSSRHAVFVRERLWGGISAMKVLGRSDRTELASTGKQHKLGTSAAFAAWRRASRATGEQCGVVGSGCSHRGRKSSVGHTHDYEDTPRDDRL